MSRHAHPAQRRARTALSCALLFFLSLQLVFAMALERLLPSVRDSEYGDKLHRLQTLLRQDPECPLVLMLGSSRTLMGFQAGEVRARCKGREAVAFNFGVRGAGPVLELITLRRLVADGIKPDLLLLEVLPALLNQPGPKPLEEEWLQGSRLRVSELARTSRYHSHPSRLVRQWLKMRWAPTAFYGRELCGYLADGVPEPPPPPGEVEAGDLDPFGWQPYFRAGISSRDHQRFWHVARNQYGPTFGDYNLAERPARALSDLLDVCARHQIRVALVFMPESAEFRALYPAAMRQGLDAYLQDLSVQRGLPLIDARDWVPDSGFWDGHHALPSGAATFTGRLEREIIAPLLARHRGRGLSSRHSAATMTR